MTKNIAQKWQAAAPNAIIDNLYGPTEATCAITSYVWDPARSPDECEYGIVPIGKPFRDQEIAICDPNSDAYAIGKEGELCLAGSQVTKGYLNDEESTKRQYVKLPNSDSLWYRTGDLVKLNARGQLLYISRIDNLIKIHGYRVELQEIEFTLTEATKSERVVAVGWPVKDGVAEKIVAFVEGEERRFNKQSIVEYCIKRLPQYMIPRDIYILPSIPVNLNGKADRKKLVEMLENGETRE